MTFSSNLFCSTLSKAVCVIALMSYAQGSSAQTEEPAKTENNVSVSAPEKGWFTSALEGSADIIKNGGWDFYVPVHTIHMPYAYTYEERHQRYNNNPFGFGIGRGKYLENGNWNGFYAMEFKDSNSYPSWMLGYGYKWLWGDSNGFYAGSGVSAFLMTRKDYGHYTPFPGIVPIFTLGFRNISVETAYVPGFRKGSGNVMLFWLRIEEKVRPRG